MKRFKRSVKFKFQDLPLLEKIINHYIESGISDEYEEERVLKIVNSLYAEEEKTIKEKIKYLEARGYKIDKN